MKTYFVTLTEIVKYVVEVEAEDEEQAHELAVDDWNQSEDPDADFIAESEGVTVSLILSR